MVSKKNGPKAPSDVAKEGEDARVLWWRKELEASAKRERTYQKEANDLIRIYEAEDEDIPYNILYSNTETLVPALYSSPPRPDTRPRSRVKNPVADAAAGLIDSQLTTFIDSGDVRYQSLDDAISASVLQAAVPGRGMIRLHYKSNVETDAEGAPVSVLDESVFPEAVPWNKVRFGYAKTWAAMPWIAFEHAFTREEAKAELGADVADKLTYEVPKDGDSRQAAEGETTEVACVLEVWDKASRSVLWLEEAGSKEFLKELADPYQLEGFYPMPEPLQFFSRISCFIPVPLYRLYKKQAAELNKVTRRIDKLIEAMKIRGFYDSNVDGLRRVFEQDDNTLIPLENLAALGQGAKAENAIWLVPIEKHVTVLQQLIMQRQQLKQVIFEIMGIADIMRGSSVASETLGAQELKNKWGTLRLKRGQKAVATFVRNTLRLAAELSFTRMAPETLRQLTGSSLPQQAELDQFELQAQAQSQLPPEAMAKMAMPSFEEALALCQQDVLRRYTIDIETNSTIDADASSDKEDLREFLGALGQFLNGLMPLMESGFLPREVLKGILAAMARRFRLGRDLDQYIASMGQGQDPSGGGKAALDKKAKELEGTQKKLQSEQQALQKQAEQVKRDKMALEQRSMQFTLQETQATIQATIRDLQSGLKGEKAKVALESLLLRIQGETQRLAQARKQDAAEDKAEDAEEAPNAFV